MLFDRKYRLTVGKAIKVDKESKFEASLHEGRNALIITEHNIDFRIGKTNSSSTNSAEITIYNLSNDTHNFMSNTVGEPLFVMLEVGYGDSELDTLCIGEISGVSEDFSTNTRRTKLIVTDGAVYASEKISVGSIPPKTKWSVAINKLVSDLGLPVGSVQYPDGVSATGWSWEGKAHDELKRLAKELDFTYSIQNAIVHFISKKNPVYPRVAKIPLLTPLSGIVGRVTPVADKAGAPQAVKEPTQGIRLKVLMNPSIQPESLIKVQSAVYDGVFRVVEVSHNGSFRNTDWTTEIVAQQISLFI